MKNLDEVYMSADEDGVEDLIEGCFGFKKQEIKQKAFLSLLVSVNKSIIIDFWLCGILFVRVALAYLFLNKKYFLILDATLTYW